MSQVTELLDKARSGDDRAWDQAVALVYDDLKRIARGVLGGGQGKPTRWCTSVICAWNVPVPMPCTVARISSRWPRAPCAS
jgi:hypothetical protein